MKMSFTSWIGTCIATMFLRQPGPKSKKKRSPLPSSTMMQVPDWSAPRRVWATADERDAHLVLADLLRAREVVAATEDRGRRLVVGRQADPAARPAAVGVRWLNRVDHDVLPILLFRGDYPGGCSTAYLTLRAGRCKDRQVPATAAPSRRAMLPPVRRGGSISLQPCHGGYESGP